MKAMSDCTRRSAAQNVDWVAAAARLMKPTRRAEQYRRKWDSYESTGWNCYSYLSRTAGRDEGDEGDEGDCRV